VRFDLTDLLRQNRYWMLLEAANAEVYVKPPGHPEDVIVTTTSEWLAKWHMGWISLAAARRPGLIDVIGPSPLIRVLGTLGLSPFAGVRPVHQSAATPLLAKAVTRPGSPGA
jgi:hypothetical protein